MPSAGELLRSERLQRNRNLPDIAAQTCISTRYLEAIEANDTSILPGDFFHRSFIRQYATALGLDEPLTKKILGAVEPAPEIDPIPAFSLPRQIAEVEQRSKPLAQIPTRVAATLFIVVLAGCSGLYALWNRAHDSEEPAPAAVAETKAAETRAAESKPAEAQPSAAVPAPAEGQTAAAAVPPPEPSSPAEPGKITVDLAATEPTWVSVSSAGKTVFSGTLDASQTKNFALDQNAKLLTGNAAGLAVRMNGRPLGPLGPRGQVRVVLFTSDEFRILSPHKM